MENLDTKLETAGHLYALGTTVRRIATLTGLAPDMIKAQAAAESWLAGPKPNWPALRHRFAQGETLADIAKSTNISISTLQKRKRRENWIANPTQGLDALRRSVAALEAALLAAPNDDPMLTTRISTALSMAALRLSRAEQGGKNTPIAEINPEQQTPEEHHAVTELARIMGDWRVDKAI